MNVRAGYSSTRGALDSTTFAGAAAASASAATIIELYWSKLEINGHDDDDDDIRHFSKGLRPKPFESLQPSGRLSRASSVWQPRAKWVA